MILRRSRRDALRAYWIQDRHGTEQPSSYYDADYQREWDTAERFTLPSQSTYFKGWQKVLRWIDSGESLLDLGCGNGWFAQLALLEGKDYRLGIDFSPVAIDWAKQRNPGHAELFVCDDIFNPKYTNLGYDIVIILETLEHIDKDLELLSMIPGGGRVIFSVPAFSLNSHVRFFVTLEEVIARYGTLLSIQRTDCVNMRAPGRHGELWFVDGVRAL